MMHLFRRPQKEQRAVIAEASPRSKANHLASAPVETDSVPQSVRLRARFWGVRGSHPAPHASGSQIGGHTACLEVRYGNTIVMVDAGSGCIPFGDALIREWQKHPSFGRPSLTVLLTHAHHDHLCGLPFLAPLYRPEAEIRLFGPDLAGIRFADIVSGYMRTPYFPVDFHDLPSTRHLQSIGDGSRLAWSSRGIPRLHGANDILPAESLVVDVLHSTLHPREGTLLYRFSAGGESLVFATDVEVGTRDGAGEQRFLGFARGANVLVHDAQYSEADYSGANPHRGYGHSTPAMAAQIARDAGVDKLVLFHHDPSYADADIWAQQDAACMVFPRTQVAHEGLEILMDGGEFLRL